MKEKNNNCAAQTGKLGVASAALGAVIAISGLWPAGAQAAVVSSLGSGAELRSQLMPAGAAFLPRGFDTAQASSEGKCGEGKCGEGKCGEGEGDKEGDK